MPRYRGEGAEGEGPLRVAGGPALLHSQPETPLWDLQEISQRTLSAGHCARQPVLVECPADQQGRGCAGLTWPQLCAKGAVVTLASTVSYPSLLQPPFDCLAGALIRAPFLRLQGAKPACSCTRGGLGSPMLYHSMSGRRLLPVIDECRPSLRWFSCCRSPLVPQC